MIACYVCGQPATVHVTVTHTDRRTTYYACDDHEPRYVPQGDVVSTHSRVIR